MGSDSGGRFRMPTSAVVHLEYVFDFVRNFELSKVTDDLIYSSLESDVIFQGIDNLLGRMHGADSRKQKVFALPTKSFASSRNVECWKLGFEMFSHGESGGCCCPLSGIIKGLFDGFSIDPTQ